jgi:hypothetical protein
MAQILLSEMAVLKPSSARRWFCAIRMPQAAQTPSTGEVVRLEVDTVIAAKATDPLEEFPKPSKRETDARRRQLRHTASRRLCLRRQQTGPTCGQGNGNCHFARNPSKPTSLQAGTETFRLGRCLSDLGPDDFTHIDKQPRKRLPT